MTRSTEAAAAVAEILGSSSPKDILHLERQGHHLSEEDVRRAFRVAALRVHPDKNSCTDAPEAFRRVCRAYHQVLKEMAKHQTTGCGSHEKGKSQTATSRQKERTPRRKRWWEHATVAEVEAALKQEEARFFAEWENSWRQQASRRSRRQAAPRFVPPAVDFEDDDPTGPCSDTEADYFEQRVSSWRCFKGLDVSSSPSSVAVVAAEQEPPPQSAVAAAATAGGVGAITEAPSPQHCHGQQSATSAHIPGKEGTDYRLESQGWQRSPPPAPEMPSSDDDEESFEGGHRFELSCSPER